jgi:hypothetical protein
VCDGTRLPEDADPGDPGHGLLELFQTLADELGVDVGRSREIAARPREGRDEAVRDRIGSRREDNGDGPGRVLGGQGCGRASSGHDHIHLECNQFSGECWKTLELPLGVSVFDHEIAALDVPEGMQSLTKGLVQVAIHGPVE